MITVAKDPLWLEIARREIGVQERRGGENPRIIEYHSYTTLAAKEDEIAWCAAFASFIMTQAGVVNPHSAWAQDWADDKYFEILDKPIHGCGCVYRWSASSGHINFFDANSGFSFGCIGGNQLDDDSGGQVSLAEYVSKQSSVIAYIWPKGWPKPGDEVIVDPDPTPPVDAIKIIVANSAIAKYSWRQRGRAPIGYIQGLAMVFAKNYLALKAKGTPQLVMSAANSGNDSRDALSWYNSNFLALGMKNHIAGVDTLRHLFVLLMGLGMRESTGKHCEGRDMSASNTDSNTCEAGAWQTSYNAHVAHAEMSNLFSTYRSSNSSGYLELFSQGVTCSPGSWKSFGSGEGYIFQTLSKNCPAFAAEFAAIGLRHIRKHWGPVGRREVEIRPEADALFLEVQKFVDVHKALS